MLAIRRSSRLLALCIVLIATRATPALATCPGERSGSGFATYYNYTTGSGACSFSGDDYGDYVAAINATDYAGSRLCGSYLRVTGPLGSVDVRIVDMCPTCGAGDIDLNGAAFAVIGKLGEGRVAITWKTVPDPVDQLPYYQLSAGSSQYFLQIQPRDTRYGIGSVEYLGPAGYVQARRETYDYFTVDGSVTPVPLSGLFTIRVTDLNGAQIVSSGIPLAANHIHPSSEQFPVCEPLDAPEPRRLAVTALRPPWPNPFHASTLIAFDLAGDADALLRLYDAGGRRVRTLLRARLGAGHHQIAWEGLDDHGRRLAPGIYFCRLTAGSAVDQGRLTLTE